MQFVLAAASVATLIGILLVPTGQRMFAAAIGWYQNNRSTTKLALKAASPGGLRTLGRSLTIPSLSHLKSWRMPKGISWGILTANCLAQSLLRSDERSGGQECDSPCRYRWSRYK